MDYKELARQLLLHMSVLRKCAGHRKINESMQGETFIINMIALHGGNVQPGEISNRMGISAARITAALNNLEKKRLITRRIDPENRRRILIELTESGNELAKQQFEMLINRTSDILSGLGEHDADELVRITGKLAENIPTHDK